MSLQLPEGVEFHHRNVAPSDYFPRAKNAASLDHSHAYLNVRGDSAYSVSIPVQEFTDLVGYRDLLQSLTCGELNAERVQ